MILWIDSQLSPHLAPWITEQFGVEAHSLSHLGLLSAADREVFDAARESGATVLTKDRDFVEILDRLGPPPQVLWVTCGNTSNQYLRVLFALLLPSALELLEAGEALVEIADASP